MTLNEYMEQTDAYVTRIIVADKNSPGRADIHKILNIAALSSGKDKNELIKGICKVMEEDGKEFSEALRIVRDM